MKKISSKSLKVIAYFKEHPDASVKAVASKFKMSLQNTYNNRRRAAEGYEPPFEPDLEPSRPLSEVIPPGSYITSVDPGKALVGAVDAILDQRATQYGRFIDGAAVMQQLKRVVANCINERGTELAFDQREALDMIIHKMGRIINGNPDNSDSWRDIAGYATLVADRLEGNAR